ncbi:MAG: hypothetical protein M1358_00605 [Chloroflexi bacterium]|nr:hypothetical protein [Chloroflexota bacterium]
MEKSEIFSRKELATHTIGYRNIMNTNHLYYVSLERRKYFGRVRYCLTWICNGIAEDYEEYKTLREAKARFTIWD